MGTKKGMRRKTARRAYEPKKSKVMKGNIFDTPLMRLFGLDK